MKRLITQAAVLLAVLTPLSPALASDAWLRVDRPGPAERVALPPQAIDYGGFLWMPADAAPRALSRARAYRFENPFEMVVDGIRFDPAEGFGSLPEGWTETSRSNRPDWRIVQFTGPVRSTWLSELRGAGLEPVQYLAPFAYLAWGSSAALDQTRALDPVRFAGDLPPAMRVPAASRRASPGPVGFMALVHEEALSELQASFEQTGASILRQRPSGRDLVVLHLSADGDSMAELARVPGLLALQRIASDGGPRSGLSGQSVTGDYAGIEAVPPGYAATLESLGVDGNDITVAVVDGGIRTSHLDLSDRILPCQGLGENPTSCTQADDMHGTHVAGAIAGTGASGNTDSAGFLRGLGIAPGAGLIQQRYCDFMASPSGCFGEMLPDGMLTIFAESTASGAVIANNSWGPAGTPQGYDLPSRQVDIITRDADPDTPGAQPVMPVWAIMNGGGDGSGDCAPSSLGSPDEAKNLLAVGSTALIGPSDRGLFDLSYNSAHGPACDGRLVPHLVAPGCSTDSTTGSGDSSHGLMCGTSMAAPIVAGAAALFFEQYRSRTGSLPSPALTKAVLTASALNLFGKADADGNPLEHRPDRKQGWGRLRLDRALDERTPTALIDQTVTFTASGQSWSAYLAVADASKPIHVQLAWTDAPGPGTGGTAPSWVNDLDLHVSVDGNEYLGNHFDPTDGYSSTGGTPDGVNNLEGVVLAPEQHNGQVVTVSVTAINLAGDALDPWQAGEPRQDFALVGRNLAAPGTPVTLEFTTQPVDVQAGQTLDPVGVTMFDAFGQPASQAQPREIELSLQGCDQLSPLSGTTILETQAGEANFTDLLIVEPGAYRLRARSLDDRLEEALSDPFRVIPEGLFQDRFEAVCLP